MPRVHVHKPGAALIRTGEFCYAAIAVVFWLFLPFPPTASELFASTNLALSAGVALMLGWRARALSPRLWWTALALCVWVLAIASHRVWHFVTDAPPTMTSIVSIALASLCWFSQLVVALGLRRARVDSPLIAR